MKLKILNACLIVTPLFGYLEWGTDSSSFLFQVEMVVLSKLFQDPVAAVHPFTLIPLFGQIMLLVTLFQREPSRLLTMIGIVLISFLLLFIAFIGVISLNYKIALSTLPFIVTAVFAVREIRKKNDTKYENKRA